MNHQRLRCYNLLIDTAKKVPALTNSWPRGSYYLEDQLRRALSSAILNLAEGNSRDSRKEKARFYDITLGSIVRGFIGL